MAPWTVAEAKSDAVSKKMLLQHLQDNAGAAFLEETKLSGQATAVLKRVTKDALVEAYTQLLGSAAKGSGSAAPASGFKFMAPAGAAPAGGDFKFSAPASGGSPAPPPAFTFSPPAAGSGGSETGFAFNFAASAPASAGHKPRTVDDADQEDGEEDEEDIGKLMQKRMERLNMSAAQRRDATLAELPAPVRERVEKLEKLQEKSDEMQTEFDEKLQALRQEYEKKKAPLFKERSELVNAVPQGVPGFWLRSLQNHMMLSEEIQKADLPVLAFLKDIKYSSSLGPGKPGFQLAFVFGENPYFSNEVLTKTYLLDPTDEDECLQRTVGTDIQWKEGKDVTVRVVEKKQKKKGKVRTVKVEEQTDSFFNFFDPPEVPEDDEDIDEEEAEQLRDQLENDYEMGCIIKDKIVPRAVAWFTGAAIDPDEDYDEDGEDDYEDGDEEEGEDDEDDEDEDEDEDGDEDDDHVDTSKMAKKAAPGPGAKGPDGQECKQQ